jgi:hypothetical protein
MGCACGCGDDRSGAGLATGLFGRGTGKHTIAGVVALGFGGCGDGVIDDGRQLVRQLRSAFHRFVSLDARRDGNHGTDGAELHDGER